MGHWLYILHSESVDKYYIGQSDNPESRLHFHNIYETGFTARYRPWKIIFKKECSSRKEALELEKKIKKWKSKIMIQLLIEGKIKL